MDNFAKEFLDKEYRGIIKNLPLSEQEIINTYINSEKENARQKVNYADLIIEGCTRYIIPWATVIGGLFAITCIIFKMDSCVYRDNNNIINTKLTQCDELSFKLKTELDLANKESNALKDKCIFKILKSDE